MIQKMKVVGQPIPRVDGVERVTGRLTYTRDVFLPDMLYARVLRCPHPHAKITRLDASKALAMPGVKAVISHLNCKVSWGAGDTQNTRYLFNNPVRFVGEAVAAVAATDRHIAEAALKQIVVEYEPLDFVLDSEEALKPGAPEVREPGNLATGGGEDMDEGGKKEPPKAEPVVYKRGDVDAAFAASDKIFEDGYHTQQMNNAQMEPRTTVASWEGNVLTIYATTQSLFGVQGDIMKDLKLPAERVRVISKATGGGFGSKANAQDHDLVAATLAKETGKPVKLEYTRREDFIALHGKWPTHQYYKVGFSKDGTIQAIELRGYQGLGPYKRAGARIEGIETWACPNVRRTLYGAYVNTSVTGNYRGPATPQGYYGMSSFMDDCAYKLGIDPVEFCLKNYTKQYQDKIPYTSSAMEECIRNGAAKFDWKNRWRPKPGSDKGPIKKGAGMSIAIYYARVGRSGAVLRLDSQGKRLHVHVGLVEVGSGAKTAMAMVAAEAMDMSIDQVRIVYGDTDQCPYGIGESGSRETNFVGGAIISAAAELKKIVKEKGLPKSGEVYAASANLNPVVKGATRYSMMANFCEVEVDTELGDIKVTKYLFMLDAGRIISPLTSLSQTRGGVIMGMGMALTEHLIHDAATGIQVNPGYYGAKLPTHMDAPPEIEVEFIETEDEWGAYGAKSIGEAVTAPVIATLGNAVYNATGKRIKELPITRSKILGA